ncbi:MAG: hypothetical protein DMF61_13220 [Blastocatellia bacterium AA13]|nr:MAG: hypothetical protein DMF61_13220 [Blastocatellia bacterium AA13]
MRLEAMTEVTVNCFASFRWWIGFTCRWRRVPGMMRSQAGSARFLHAGKGLSNVGTAGERDGRAISTRPSAAHILF